jgi:hypothetical protein
MPTITYFALPSPFFFGLSFVVKMPGFKRLNGKMKECLHGMTYG